jgi:tetratricopeptide (TPR) repeat protein
VVAALVLGLVAARCTPADRETDSAPSNFDASTVPAPDATDMEPRVAGLIRTFREAVLDDPVSAEAWGRLGVVFDAHELYPPAVTSYRAAHQRNPGEFRWAYFLARVLEITAAPEDEIVGAYRAASELNPGYVPLLVRYGDALARLARPEEARQLYEQGLSRDPRFARAHRGLGQVLLPLGEPELAVTHLEKAVELNPDDGAAQSSLARAYARAGDRAAARRAQGRARELVADHVMPDPVLEEVSGAAVSAVACLRRARFRLERGEAGAALQDLAIAAEVRTRDPVVQALFGSAYAQLRRDEEALRHFARSLEIRENAPEVHAERAIVLVRDGRLGEAIAHYRRAIELSPDDAAIVARLGSALAQAGDLPSALTEFDRASRLGELDAAAQNNWGSALAQSGRPAEALPHFEEAVRLDPRFANAHFNLGVTLEGVNQADRAIAHYRRAVEIDPTHRARGRLAHLSGSSTPK